MTPGCGCKICKFGWEDEVNSLIKNGSSLTSVNDFLKTKNIKVSQKMLNNHLKAFGIFSHVIEPDQASEIVQVDMKNFEFNEYGFREDEPMEVVKYLQRLQLRIYLNQTKMTLKEQEDVLAGRQTYMSADTMRNQALSLRMLNEITSIAIFANQQAAIRKVESLGYVLDKTTSRVEN